MDRFFLSSRLCSACGTLAERMPLSVPHLDVQQLRHDARSDLNATKSLWLPSWRCRSVEPV
ncbi:hypothetical protein ADL30_35170 [Streptomyces sp. NRRL S-1521]|nr:hypothetical protein ADL30_35170 [Streptomyces sp. NRRL S-1521]